MVGPLRAGPAVLALAGLASLVNGRSWWPGSSNQPTADHVPAKRVMAMQPLEVIGGKTTFYMYGCMHSVYNSFGRITTTDLTSNFGNGDATLENCATVCSGHQFFAMVGGE